MMALSSTRQRAAAAQILRGKAALPVDPEEWGRAWPLEPGEATRLVRAEARRRAIATPSFRLRKGPRSATLEKGNARV